MLIGALRGSGKSRLRTMNISFATSFPLTYSGTHVMRVVWIRWVFQTKLMPPGRQKQGSKIIPFARVRSRQYELCILLTSGARDVCGANTNSPKCNEQSISWPVSRTESGKHGCSFLEMGNTVAVLRPRTTVPCYKFGVWAKQGVILFIPLWYRVMFWS